MARVPRLLIFIIPLFSRFVPLFKTERINEERKGVIFHGKIVDIAEAFDVTRSLQAIIDITPVSDRANLIVIASPTLVEAGR